MTIVVNHTAQALNLLATQFKGKPGLAAFISAFTDELQELETAIQQVKFRTRLEYAEGSMLDIIGDAVDRSRVLGQDDPTYLNAIRIKILRNAADGTPDAAIRLIKLVTQCGFVDYFESDVRSPNFAHNGTPVPTLLGLLREIAPAGCGPIYLSQPGESAPEVG